LFGGIVGGGLVVGGLLGGWCLLWPMVGWSVKGGTWWLVLSGDPWSHSMISSRTIEEADQTKTMEL